MFTPEAYITAIKQCVAQANNWSLEELVLNVIVHDRTDVTMNDSSFGVVECKLQGAVTKSNKILLDDENIYSNCKLIELKWTKESQISNSNVNRVTLPVYLNSQRTELLLRIDVCIGDDELVNENAFYEKGVAFLASTIGS